MQCNRQARRSLCDAYNAYNASTALGDAFSLPVHRRQLSLAPTDTWRPHRLTVRKIGKLESRSLPVVGRRVDHQAKDIVVDDLTATLEAHRESNRATIVRKLDQRADDDTYRPQLKYAAGTKSKASLRQGENTEAWKAQTRAYSNENVPGQRGTYESYEALLTTLSQGGTQTSAEKVRKVIPASPSSEDNLVESARNNQSEKKSEKGHDKATRGADDSDAGSRDHPWKRSIRRVGEAGQRLAKSKGKASIQPKQLHYEGRAIPPASPKESLGLPLPWIQPGKDFESTTGKGRLQAEINGFSEWIQPSALESAAREEVVAQLRQYIKKVLGSDFQAELFGSQKTGLAVPSSDIDIRVCVNEKVASEAGSLTTDRYRMVALAKAMIHDNPDYMLVVFRHAKYPIISAQHRETGLDVQIVMSPSSEPSQQYVKKYLAEYPHLKTVYMLLRMALGLRGLTDVFNGGVGSYSLFIMIVAALKHVGVKPGDTAADQLLRVFDFYRNLHASQHGISVEPATLFPKRDVDKGVIVPAELVDPILRGQNTINCIRPYQSYLMCLQDPANPVNDLGCKSYAIKHIFATFKYMQGFLIRNLDPGRQSESRTWMREGFSLLLPLLGRCHEIYDERRARMDSYGMDVLAKKRHQQRGPEASTETGTQYFTPADAP